MANYLNSSREIRVGDRVRGIGSLDGRCVDGLLGTVILTYPWGLYACGVRFDRDMGGHSLEGRCESGHGFKVMRDNIAYIGNEVADGDTDGKRYCFECGRAFEKSTRLGVRLFKDAILCDECVTKKIGRVNCYHSGKDLSYAYAKDKITLGVEIEIDDVDDYGDSTAVINRVIDCARKNNYALIMSHERDGSLDYGGFESVTAPLTVDEWKSNEVRDQVNALFDGADEHGFTLNRGHAGLHVHIGRKDLCGTDRTKSDAVGLLMGWAVARLWENGFNKLSRRRNMDYCHLFNEDGRGHKGLYDTNASEHDRYYAVNISNSATIELRIFKGARDLDDVIVAVDMCYMLAKWATKKINAFDKRNSYSARAKKYDDALAYADRITWDALVKYSKFPEVTLKRMREVGIKI